MEHDTPTSISAHDFDIVRKAFRSSVAEGLVTERQWVQHAKDLIRELTGHKDPDEGLIRRIVGR